MRLALRTHEACFFPSLVKRFASLLAQTATLRGVVTDESGAVIPAAQVTVNGPGGARSATTGDDGSYTVAGLGTGDYTVQASAPDLTLPQPVRVTLNAGVRTLNLQLKVAATVQQITVEDTGAPTVVSPLDESR